MTTAERSSERSPGTRKKSTTPAHVCVMLTVWGNSRAATTTGKRGDQRNMTTLTTIRCNHCQTLVVHDKRNVAGCNCDPDAPQWCYIMPDGRVRGFSQADWTVLE